MKIICITPIKHIEGLYDKLKSYGEIIYEPHITKEQLKTLLKNSHFENMTAVFLLRCQNLLRRIAPKMMHF